MKRKSGLNKDTTGLGEGMKQFIRFMVGDDYNTGIGRALRGFLAEL
jgi:hypothetical protein